MQKTEFLTIFATYENLDIVKETLPTIIEETKRNNAKLIVHDSSDKGRKEKWDYLQELNKDGDFFLVLSDNLSMAHARNMCLQLGQELYAPEYICMLEDDHAFNPGLIQTSIQVMREYYGKVSPNGLRYGLFTGCTKHTHAPEFHKIGGDHLVPTVASDQITIGGCNSCFRCAPTSHWTNVLKGYDTDEYLISTFQTGQLGKRNYNKGFTALYINNGKLVYEVNREGRGFTDESEAGHIWDDEYTASDPRSNFRGKENNSKITNKNTQIVKNRKLVFRAKRKIKHIYKKIIN